ncbi:MAG: VOC family protein, partial [Rubrivivax sp.]|nr:VOC family protein [Rubrivivax sp.]
MIGYVTLGTQDLPRAAAFYDALLAELGAKRLMDFGRGIAWGVAWDKPSLGIMLPFDGQPATVGNGVMVALVVQTPAQVDALYKKALELGATDAGPAGPRGEGFY